MESRSDVADIIPVIEMLDKRLTNNLLDSVKYVLQHHLDSHLSWQKDH